MERKRGVEREASEAWEAIDSVWAFGDTQRLLACAYRGDALGMKKALERGDPRAVDGFGRSVLTLAALSGSMECVEIILPLSDPSSVDHQGATALIAACGRSGAGAAIVRALARVSDLSWRNSRGRTAMMEAAVLNNATEGKLAALLEIAPDREGEIGARGESALTLAVSVGRWINVELLLKAGADPLRARDDGHTAISLAAIDGSPGVEILAAHMALRERESLERETRGLADGAERAARLSAGRRL